MALIKALAKLASSAETQRASDFPPEELRLEWEDAFAIIENRSLDKERDGACTRICAIRTFNEYLWSLPAEPDPMWHRDNLDKQPWPIIRTRASDLLASLGHPYAFHSSR
ncbi:hypothetical protein [Sphingomonas lycopersici]|uniref:Uncharacterized protein n=1 Tax=Sphingomonas lycopersici TaxID=2951807 RepID=A0AA41ZGP9_9SPHN|nr:hypothetical protein [Sphingomonas lycopersici]MCW6536291.1 hypothetical protein [Sphingomonas lycopersici]